jgi:hypothetical protein
VSYVARGEARISAAILEKHTASAATVVPEAPRYCGAATYRLTWITLMTTGC